VDLGPGDPLLFGNLYTSQLVLGTSTSSLAYIANPLCACHNALHNVYQLEIIKRLYL